MRTKSWRRCALLLGLAILVVAAGGADEPLPDAAKYGDWGAMRLLLEQGADVNAPQADGTTALHWAAYWDHGDSAELLIRAGARVNVANDLGVTPLWTASENGSAAMVRTLLQAGANPNAALSSGETLVMTAARTGNADVVEQLLAKGADVNAKEHAYGAQTALMWAVAQQHADVVDVLLAHGADVAARSDGWTEVVKTVREAANPAYIMDLKQGGYTPLLFAARVGDLASAKLLVAAGADVNDLAPSGTSAVVVAAHSGHGELAAFLLENGADPTTAGAGYTALHAAIMQKDEQLAEALLVHGANPNAPILKSTPTRRSSADFYFGPGFVGATPFWLAARFGVPEIMRRLAEHGADPLVVHHPAYYDGNGIGYFAIEQPYIEEGSTTALMAAVGLGDIESGRSPLVAVTVLDRIAEATPVGRQEPDPVKQAAIALEAVRLAIELGVDVNTANADGNTALHAAASRGYDGVIELLVENGATVAVTNNEGQTPLALAMDSGRGSGRGTGDTAYGRGGAFSSSTVELLQRLGGSR